MQLLVAHDPDAQRVDEGVAGVRRVERDLTADVGQAEAVAVPADPRDDARQDPRGVRRMRGSEPQRVHDGDRAGAHREDVADDAADSGRRSLVRLDVARVVVRLDLERHRVPLADVDDARVLTDAREELADRRLGREVAELAQVHLARLVRAVLAPHDRVHGQLARRRTTSEDLADALVLLRAQPERCPRLLGLGGLARVRHRVDHGAQPLLRRCSTCRWWTLHRRAKAERHHGAGSSAPTRARTKRACDHRALRRCFR